MIDRVRKDPLEFNHDVNSCLSVLACRDVSKPLVTGCVQVLLKDVGHDLQSLLEEHVPDCLSLGFPLVVCRHDDEHICEHWLDYLLEPGMLVQVRIVLVVHLCDNFGVLHHSDDLPNYIDSDHSVF